MKPCCWNLTLPSSAIYLYKLLIIIMDRKSVVLQVFSHLSSLTFNFIIYHVYASFSSDVIFPSKLARQRLDGKRSFRCMPNTFELLTASIASTRVSVGCLCILEITISATTAVLSCNETIISPWNFGMKLIIGKVLSSQWQSYVPRFRGISPVSFANRKLRSRQRDGDSHRVRT